jgi:hypothetical protein
MLILLRGHIVGCSDISAGQVNGLVQDLSDSEITQFDHIITQEYIGRFQVPMQYSFVMHIKDGEGNLTSPIDNLWLLKFLTLCILNNLIDIPVHTILHNDI